MRKLILIATMALGSCFANAQTATPTIDVGTTEPPFYRRRGTGALVLMPPPGLAMQEVCSAVAGIL